MNLNQTVMDYINKTYDEMSPNQRTLAEEVAKRVKRIKRKRRLQNKYRLTR